MDLGLFFMPLHRPEKPFRQSLEEDRQTILLADELGFSEVWMGEHFSSKAEPIPAPLIFLATLIQQTKNIRFGTGVVNLGHRHPVVVAAEAALFDQLSGGRLMLGVGPGGLASDGELFGRPDMAERVKLVRESIDMIIQAMTTNAPLDVRGAHWQASLQDQIWTDYGVGELPKPLQQPHPPIAMALSSPKGDTVKIVAERSFIPISANFVPLSAVKGQWDTYSEVRNTLGLPVDRSIWRVCRNILVTESDAHAEEILADPDGVFAFYFRYLAGVRDMPRLNEEPGESITELNQRYQVDESLEKCVIAGSPDTVTAKLNEMVDFLGPFGTLVSVGHDDQAGDGMWEHSLKRLKREVAPIVTQHMQSRPATDYNHQAEALARPGHT
jgi:alkanesulfonate monooxygenase SsuD/methylene tetrahydromethanopterin reductase-like flavin-dependent oxidoreductase (luciferase family)